ncbi:MAG TPA: hypothetical protein VIJ60_14030, partial [Acidimicrobiales bacterium]
RLKAGAVLVGLVLAGTVLAACSSGSGGASGSTTTTASSATSGIKAAVTAFLSGQGVQSFKYDITKADVSTTDSTWAYFFVAPVHADQADFQSFYGFAQKTGGSWKVVSSGSSEVGCPPGAAGNGVVPSAVLSEFGLTCPPSTTTTTTAATTTTAPPAATTTTSQQSALTAAVTAFQTSEGVPQSKYLVTKVQVSTVQSTWAIFSVGPSTTSKATFQGGYGFLHRSGGTWSVASFGSAEVGCPPGAAGNTVVPTAVLAGFGQSCPTTATTTTS